MRAVRLHDVKDLRYEQIDAPGAPGPGSVLIAVEAAGICGSDLHNFSTGQWISRRPSVAGHEFCGRIAAVGQGVSDLSVGQAVVADSRCWCGECPQCRDGHRNACERLGFVGEVCDGGFAEQVILPARLVQPRPEAMDPRVAAMSEPLAVALHAINKVAPADGAAVLVVGCGTIGGLCALALSHRHNGPLLLADRNADRARMVAEVTGGQVVDLTPDAIAAANRGRPLRFAIDATGSIAALRQLLEVIGPNSVLGLVGISHGKLDLDPNQLVEREIQLVGCHAFKDELPEAIALADARGEQLLSLIDEEISLDQVPAAFERLLAGHVKGLKTIISIR
ncbi:dehydrogenase [Devosia insulae DS-56]|uniref:Dehydrogenase n=1 Tax=Devosia insulae DS-56 TaxID=1116389 RepID=A0A1E5XSW8_9HYPH|nr:alcohol dehydrogenase catalytic domain-containing protein [Devosia insulae]OEO31696.1 dehydrogenase [Devosia insulae DS-56]